MQRSDLSIKIPSYFCKRECKRQVIIGSLNGIIRDDEQIPIRFWSGIIPRLRTVEKHTSSTIAKHLSGKCRNRIKYFVSLSHCMIIIKIERLPTPLYNLNAKIAYFVEK